MNNLIWANKKCPICQNNFSEWIYDAPCCRDHGRFGWYRRFGWNKFGWIRKFFREMAN